MHIKKNKEKDKGKIIKEIQEMEKLTQKIEKGKKIVPVQATKPKPKPKSLLKYKQTNSKQQMKPKPKPKPKTKTKPKSKQPSLTIISMNVLKTKQYSKILLLLLKKN